MATSNRTIGFPGGVDTFKSLTDLLSEALFLVDRFDRIVLANHAAQAITGLPESALLGQSIGTVLSLTVPKQVKFRHPPTWRLLSIPATVHNRTHSATFVSLPNLTCFAALIPRPIALVIVTPETPSQIQDQTTATIYLQIVGQLTMRIAHHLNNSLTSIVGNAELVKEQLDHGSPELDDVIRKSLEMALFIDKLQQYARQKPSTSYPFDLNIAIYDFLRVARSLLDPMIQVDFLPSDDLPQIYMDRPRIDQVLMSILLTCKNNMPSGGRITIETERATLDAAFASTHSGARIGSYSRLSITDSSNGMNSKQLARIFDFPRGGELLGTATLGLPIVYSIVKEFKGYIAVESWLGKGTRFDVYIPSFPISISASEHQHSLDPSSLTDSPTSSLTTNSSLILVADDDLDIQRTISRYLSKAGYQTTFSGDGKTTLDLYKRLTAESNQPALLITDLGLPEIDGLTLSITIKQLFPTARILLTSGYRIDHNPTTKETQEGFVFLQKPFQANALLATIERMLKHDAPHDSSRNRATPPANARQKPRKV